MPNFYLVGTTINTIPSYIFFLVPLTVELDKLCLNEGQRMDLFSIEQINMLQITPSLKKNIHKIDQKLLYQTK